MSDDDARRGSSVAWVALAAAALLAAAAIAFVALRGPAAPFDMQARVRDVAAGLRCPVCQNLSVADSPSALAREMRSTIEQRLRAGESPDGIREDFVRAYGEWILLDPPRRGINLVAWLAPLALLIGGLALAAVAVVRWTRTGRNGEPEPAGGPEAPASGAPGALSDADRRRLAEAIAASDGDVE
jgi:cytochrome c-type biogenesis protein CcmH